jgi:hypothetical protein
MASSIGETVFLPSAAAGVNPSAFFPYTIRDLVGATLGVPLPVNAGLLSTWTRAARQMWLHHKFIYDCENTFTGTLSGFNDFLQTVGACLTSSFKECYLSPAYDLTHLVPDREVHIQPDWKQRILPVGMTPREHKLLEKFANCLRIVLVGPNARCLEFIGAILHCADVTFDPMDSFNV